MLRLVDNLRPLPLDGVLSFSTNLGFLRSLSANSAVGLGPIFVELRELDMFLEKSSFALVDS